MSLVPEKVPPHDNPLPDRLSRNISRTTFDSQVYSLESEAGNAVAGAGCANVPPIVSAEVLHRQLADVETELTAVNAGLEQLFVQFNDPILVISDDGVVLTANNAAERLFQCPVDMLVGTVLGTPMQGREGAVMEIHRRYGDVVTTDARINLSVWEGVPAYTLTLRDVGNRCQTVDTIDSAKQAAEHANRMKSQFLANMSHELRTPLNSIIGFADVMCNGTYGEITHEKYRKYIDYVYVSGKQLLDLINDLLYLAKAEAGKLELRARELNIADVVMASVQALQPDIARKQLKLVAAGPLPQLMVNADEAKISQILVSLLSNAVKFTLPEGQITIDLKLDRNANLQITISDTGIGIAPSVLANIFQPFVHIDQVYSYTGENGSGLNLALARRLALLHDGDLVLKSEVNVGSEATFTLPAQRVIGHK